MEGENCAQEEQTYVFRIECESTPASCSNGFPESLSSNIKNLPINDKSRMREAGHCPVEVVDDLWAQKSKKFGLKIARKSQKLEIETIPFIDL